MNTQVIRQHLARAWRRHWALQLATVTVMSSILLVLNLMFLGFSVFNHTLAQWGRGMEMIVYLKENADPKTTLDLKAKLEKSGDFDNVEFVSKQEATKKFLTALGPESLTLLQDPKWSSPIPASLDLRLSENVPVERRLSSLQSWNAQFKGFDFIEDVFYGQGWIENFTQFLRSLKGVVVVIWTLALSVGLLIVNNCIQLSFSQRHEEIAILELVGATSRFIRWPFICEGLALGIAASLISLGVSFFGHAALLTWLSSKWSFWIAFQQVAPLPLWSIAVNLFTGALFGLVGAWNCVRRLNTGWAAAG